MSLTGTPQFIFQAAVAAFALILPLLFLLITPQLTREILRDLRLPRILHYAALAGLGMALYLKAANMQMRVMEADTLLAFFVYVICLAYAAVFAIITNNMEDLEADRITNRERPLVRGTVNRKAYLRAGIFCQLMALGMSALVNWEMFAGIVAVSAGYYLYSCRPFRLKRIPLLSKLLIGINSLAVALAGYALLGGNVMEFPWEWMLFILLPLSLAANFVDLKDTDGDRATGIATLPVLLGEKKARIVIAIATAAAYLMAGLLLADWRLALPNAALTALHLWFLFRKPYNEKPVFMVYVTGLVGLDVFLLIL